MQTGLTPPTDCETNRIMSESCVEDESVASRTPSLPRRLATAGTRIVLVAIPAAGLLTWFAGGFWLSDLLANLRLQLVMAGAAAVLFSVAARHWKMLIVQALFVGLHLPWLMNPPTPAAMTPHEESTLTVTSVNAFIHNREYERVAAVLAASSSDIIAVTELTRPLYEQLQETLGTTHPFVAAEPDLGAFGAAIFSRYPLSDAKLLGRAPAGTTLLATAQAGDRQYRIAAVHPISPMSPGRFHQRNEHLQTLSREITELRQSDPNVSVVVAGDFNLTPWSPHFPQFLEQSGLQHVADGAGIEPTWYAQGVTTFPAGLVLDHCFVTPDLTCVSHRVGPSVASDHLPVTVQLARTQLPATDPPPQLSQTVSAVSR